LSDIIDEVVLPVQHEGLIIAFRCGSIETALPAVLGDRVQLQQVIMNLLINGIQAMTTVTDRPHELFIRSHRHEGEQVLIEVQDTGVGIPPENMKQLFNAFFSTKSNGMGMGLSICRSIVEAHWERIWASGNAGPGATFHVTLRSAGEAAS
jgi:signal transduction histidine kinase